jgi:chemotaxis protein MotB
MAKPGNGAPVIIKRKKIIAGGGHHGGAWKVAYADFVTAMMAFFLLMWLLNATTEQQRKGIADFFNPSVPVSRVSGGGDGAFGGDDVFSENTLTKKGLGSTSMRPSEEKQARGDTGTDAQERETQSLEQIAKELRARGGESMTMEQALRHVVTRVTDEGLVIEVFDLPGAPLFEGDGAVPRPVLAILARTLAESFVIVANPLAIQGHVRSYPITLIDNPTWALSSARAHAMRGLIEDAGFDPTRIQRVTGFADRRLTDPDPMAPRNNRLEMILLRKDR